MIPNLAVQLGVVSIHDLKAYTTYELITLLARRINEMIQNINQFESDSIDALKAMAQELDDLLRGDKVESEINKTLIEWKDSGVFDHLIQGSVFIDFENRLSDVQGEMPILKQEVQETLNETKKQISMFNQYSFEDYPVFYKSLYGKRDSVMQMFAKLKNGTWLFSQVGADGAPSTGESFTISRLDNNGELLDYMRIYHGGHGVFQVIEKGSELELYFTADDTKNFALIKTTYQANSILDLSSNTGYQVLPQTNNQEKKIIAIDYKNDLIMLSSKNALGVYYKADVYRFSDYITGRQTQPTTTLNDITPNGQTIQGTAINGDVAIFYHGEIGDKCMLRVFDLETGKRKDYHYPKLGYSHNLDSDSMIEGEGCFIDNEGNLYLGVSTGSPGTIRANHIYVFTTIKESLKFISETLEATTTYKYIEGDGHAMWYEPKPKTLAEITKPGWYYFMADEFDFTDIPEEYRGVSGFWLNVYPRAKDNTVYQELIRNTSGENQWRFGRQIHSNGTPAIWRNLNMERKTLHSGDTRTQEVITLKDDLRNYDCLIFRVWHEGGVFTTETVFPSIIEKNKKLHFHGINIGDSSSSLAFYAQEMEVTVDEDFRTLRQVRKSRLKLDNGGTITRQEDSSIGIHEIIGIRGYMAL